MSTVRITINGFLLTLSLLLVTDNSAASFATTVPVSAERATDVASSLFPMDLEVGSGHLLLTNPTIVYLQDGRIGLKAQLQAYERHPKKNIAISETGQLRVSGQIGYDGTTRQILLAAPKLDTLQFDRTSDITKRLHRELAQAWQERAVDPVRVDLPDHPFVLMFSDGLQDLTYENRQILIKLLYP